ncbi:Ada metal-binding domain-containing protein [Geothrix alkalitolerans]|uniref:Ada metal-binding domain-containing protein n=1 Tax=Geothrix alkalitolerans TaxID=2922724 RepID=UPI001FB021BA|nr:Ada metal-binding domain-containing protein [Geothrix alkalitolerans]
MRTLQLLTMAALMASQLAAHPYDKPKAEVEAKAKAKAEVIVGCKETKVYHKANCKWVKEIDKAHTRVDFKSVAEAKQAGMKPCEDCKPGD